MTLGHPRVIVGLTGGIAAYKVVTVIRRLVERGCDVHVIASESSLNFVGMATLEAISRNPVNVGLFDGVTEVKHVSLGQSADVILIAPATANTLANLAEGRADSLLLTTVLAASCPVIIAPAMHTEMWENDATQANTDTLVSRGYVFVGPDTGRLTGSDTGVGRLADEDAVVDVIFGQLGPRDFDGVRVVVSAGGTREPIDPVRFIGNRSTGEMGVRLVEALLRRGADVTLIAAHLEVPVPRGVDVVIVSTAAEMLTAVETHARNADVFISAAAVSDFRVANSSKSKLSKSAGPPVRDLGENPDMVKEFAHRHPSTFVVGFAAETTPETFLDTVASKAKSKGVDLMVGNLVGPETGFGNTVADIVLVDSSGATVSDFHGTKANAANNILDYVSRQRAATS
jgi:phosphopantothenoylcysteine decarboxylase/phosphopantothenate--cysteine ligase